MMKKYVLSVIVIAFILVSFSIAAADEENHSIAVVDITQMDIGELQDAVDDGKLTYKQIMTLYLERIEEYSQMYNCIISVSETAIEEAEACDEIYEKQGRSSDIFGLPIIVKDNIDVEGMVTTNGSLAMSGNVAEQDAEIVAALKEAGGIIVAKANMDKYAEHSQYSISDFGRVNNAFDLSKSSYGSSGGSAVAAAASLAPICVGTDTNASIRVPASANGVVGIRPTKGLLSTEGITVCISERDTAGPLAKSVTDAAIILTAMGNFQADYTQYLSDESLEDMRVGVITSLSYGSDEIEGYFEDALDIIEGEGAEIVMMNFSLPSGYDADVSAYRQVFTSAMDRYDVDVAVYLTIRSTVMSHSQAANSIGNSNGWAIAPSAGAPAMTVPMAIDSYGMPAGIEFVGRCYDEGAVIGAGYDFEQALGLEIETTLAPPLYEISDEISDLLELAEQPVFGQIRGYEKEYDDVMNAYQEAISYLESDYYDDADADEKAETLLEEYEKSISDYEESYEKWERNVNLAGICTVLAAIVLYAVIIIIRRKKKSAA